MEMTKEQFLAKKAETRTRNSNAVERKIVNKIQEFLLAKKDTVTITAKEVDSIYLNYQALMTALEETKVVVRVEGKRPDFASKLFLTRDENKDAKSSNILEAVILLK